MLCEGNFHLLKDQCFFLLIADPDFSAPISEAVPKRILELMNVPGLTRENVASHLQVSLPYV